MAKGFFEVSGTPVLLKGEIEGELYEVGGADPTTIIRTDQAWYIRLHWKLQGTLVNMICGEWCINVHLESMGRGREFNFPEDGDIRVPLSCKANGEYWADVHVPAGKITPEDCASPYKVVTTLTYRNPCDKPGPIAGFVEGPLVTFYPAD